MEEKDLLILKSLFNGNHLNKIELKRANSLLYALKIEIEKEQFKKDIEGRVF